MLRTRLGQLLLAGTGAAHLIPAAAVVSRERVEGTYGIVLTDADADLELLLRHRATFFAMLGTGLVGGAFVPRYRRLAILSGIVSLGSFIALAESIDGANPRLEQVKRVDIALVAALVAAGALTAGRDDS